jgi:cellulose synthase/poly-beta-1,6-N-acetylglucosamine synthase-like glycosyltransferase
MYTILVPMFREPNTLPILSNALRRMDYPLSKLDIKLVLEEGDDETIQAAKALGLEGIFEIIRVPPSQPKTKPKACNYALNFARGEFVTIYDAEDKPEPDQLKKVVAAFRQAPDNVACIQARLNYFNSSENWLTRMFTLEYSLWFDFYLPALEALRIPIPLGGTSNHFKMSVLRECNAWDPFNVTEDADLGVRLTQRGYQVGVVNSTTFEEANNHVGNWIRQRSRWIKGYMQTYLVHMRNPARFYRSLGHTGFWGFQFFIGGNIVTVLTLPVMLAMYAVWLASRWHGFDAIFPPSVLYISLFNLIFGNGFFIYLNMLGAYKRHNYRLMPFALTVPAYWLLMSIAGFKALYQLIHNPFYWEKTHHGLSQYQHDDLQSARPPTP